MKLTKAEIEEIIVGCYTDDEATMGWTIYMDENINYPFEAEYLAKKKSGEKQWQKVTVVDNETDDSNFEGGVFFVEIELNEMLIS